MAFSSFFEGEKACKLLTDGFEKTVIFRFKQGYFIQNMTF